MSGCARRDFAGTLLRFVDEVLARPPRPAPDVAWDFWAQFEQFERFEELRQFRPALFQALPAVRRPVGSAARRWGPRQRWATSTTSRRAADPAQPRQ